MVWTDLNWTLATILGQINKNNIEFAPVMDLTDKQMSCYIENIFLEIPERPIILARKPKSKTQYTAINSNFQLSCLEMFNRNIPLSELTVMKELNGKNYQMLDADNLRVLSNSVIRTLAVIEATGEYLNILKQRTAGITFI